MISHLDELFSDWLIANPSIADRSVSSYISYFNRACKTWDTSMNYLKPLKDSLFLMINKEGYHNVIEQVLLTLEDQILQQIKEGKIVKKSGENVRTGIHRFQEFVDSTHFSNENASLPSLLNLPSPKEIVAEIEEDDYDIEILRKKFQNSIAGGQRREFPARILNSILKKVSSDSWIQESIEKISILTEGGMHYLKGIDRFKVKDGILYVRPIVYRDSSLVAKGTSIIDSNGFVRVLGYHSDGSIHPFKVVVRADGSIDFASISIDHCPAISLVMSTGKYTEFEKVNKGQECNPRELKKEFDHINSITSYILMERSENSSKGNKW